jgi:hypothetical protein
VNGVHAPRTTALAGGRGLSTQGLQKGGHIGRAPTQGSRPPKAVGLVHGPCTGNKKRDGRGHGPPQFEVNAPPGLIDLCPKYAPPKATVHIKKCEVQCQMRSECLQCSMAMGKPSIEIYTVDAECTLQAQAHSLLNAYISPSAIKMAASCSVLHRPVVL